MTLTTEEIKTIIEAFNYIDNVSALKPEEIDLLHKLTKERGNADV